MPRTPRKLLNTLYFHVMTKGYEDRNIYLKDEDKEKLLNLYGKQENIKILSYCIMSNHSHLLLKTPSNKELSRAMARINQAYSYYYKKKYGYAGNVFKDRFKSVPVMNEKQIFENVRYIQNNPIDAGICSNLEGYKFSSFREYLSNEDGLIDREFKEYVLNSFGGLDEFVNFHAEMQDYKESLKKFEL
jgi:putative transposase